MAVRREHTPQLEFYWYEPKRDEALPNRWGQLAGSIHRLRQVADELESVIEEREVELALTRLAYHVENYLNHVYELRDRALGVLTAITNRPKLIDKLRDLEQRPVVISTLREIDPALSEVIDCLLCLVQDDINMRNKNTHNTYLNLGLWTSDDIYDRDDALRDLKSQRDLRRQLERDLRREIKRFAHKYEGKIQALCVITSELLHHADPIRKGRPSTQPSTTSANAPLPRAGRRKRPR